MELDIQLVGVEEHTGNEHTFRLPANLTAEQSPFSPAYATVFSLDTLLQRVEEIADSEEFGARFLAREILRRVEDAPALRGPQLTMEVIERHQDTLDLLFTALMSPLDRATRLFKVALPFSMVPIYVSPALQRILGQQDVCYSFSCDMAELRETLAVMVGCRILNQCYGVEVDFAAPALLTVPDPNTGLQRFYKPLVSTDYAEVVVEGPLPPLSKADIQHLLNNIHDGELWLRKLPPESFSFRGFHLSQLHEVTQEESLSRLKHRLISRDAVLDVERVKELAELVRLHFQLPNLQLGLTAVDFPLERAIDHEHRIRYNLLADQVDRLVNSRHAGGVYDRSFSSGEMLVVEDLRALPSPTDLERKLIGLGYRSLLLAPLLSQDKHVIGLVEVACPTPNALNALMKDRFQEIRGLFRTAVERSREYIDNRIEVILREQYTSLHPAVEWRFTEAAFNILQRLEDGLPEQPEEIKFKKVYPLYGQADIVGSSDLRNTAIYQDLVDNLRAARFFLTRAMDLVDFPIVKQVVMTLDVHLAVTLEEFDSSHEIRFSEFIQQRLTPLIEQLGGQIPQLRELMEQYRGDLNQDLGLFYRVRRDYEQSVHRLNQMIGDFLSDRDQAAQRILPHYFEKYKTDGVEYEIYAGQSMLKRHEFTRIHLSNLRLSQLVDMCELTRRVGRLSQELPMPLRTAQLVFAYTTPLNIRFRMDEKRFDVDGDYNVRYEILKKRIDKATIRQGQERLTQPGMISIVYMQDRDADEYQDYLHYLHQANYIDGAVENLVLDPLQSVNGLRALRFRVKE
ncbi:GAF domain-containing protein [Lewinella sp. JB7]|uniref:GAF domain-containing protein n=1 Tax=Lewinella sp. JB7 TaxID=2962887 RepID=UPI0020C93F67|nr:GAF domain-containing protein [Lewinella sp. JB7]MCP9236725.1 GAF domain-containing protein [Lewinella sp. JB7]